jgi:hypothetical protein
MADPPDLQDLARRYLDLWQDQLRAMAADPDMMATVGRMLAASARQPETGKLPSAAPDLLAWWQTAAAALQPLQPMGGATHRDPGTAARRPSAEARSEAASAPSDGGGGSLRDIERRLAALEARLDALEPGAGARRGSAQAKPRRSKR